jgi:predicted RNase H-like nuclease (RuvC/YqgF family)
MTPPNPQEQPTYKPWKKANRKERKRVQNRDAATRYRSKKKTAQRELDEQVALLEAENKKLKDKAAELLKTCTLLKTMCEEIMKEREAAGVVDYYT